MASVEEDVLELRHLMYEHFQDDARNFGAMNALLTSIDKKLTPIAETYTSASRVGRWVMVLLTIASLTVGIIYGVNNLHR